MLRGINRQEIFEEPEDYWTFIKINEMRMKTVMNHSQGGGLLKMIRRTDPVTKNLPENLEVS